ncbi:MAG: S41 family peptidase [Thermodesulfobacteriota bacterium]|nr:S41 family peptidase [Thermodesulfobacteriota bacterium]
MGKHTTRWIKIGTALIIISFILTIGAGFYGNISANNDSTYEELKIFSSVIKQLEEDYVDPVDTKELIGAAIEGMVESLDPHSQYLPPDAYKELQTDTRGEFEGIGIVITMPKGVLTVISPIEGTPAYEAGITTGDIITKIDGKATADLELWEAVKLMRGEKGTTVTISVRREGVQEEMTFDLVRDVIPIISVKSIIIQPGYGYVWVTNFQSNTTDELRVALKELREDNGGPLKGLILDLRNNPGGLLDQAIAVSDMFLEDGVILSVKERENEKMYEAHANGQERSYPIVTLINSGSASASEIVAGALQDHHRSLIIGTTSFGKGSVQTVKPLGNGAGIKYTIARYYTPSGRSIQTTGITPDIVVKHQILEDDAPSGFSHLKEKDLKNHLEAKPRDADEETPDKMTDPDKGTPDGEDKEDETLQNNKYGSLNLEAMLKDSQVRRALDALISYEIFSGINGN